MRKTVRLFSQTPPEERLARAISRLSPSVRQALVAIADREDLPLVAGTWQAGDGGCLVANVCRVLGDEVPVEQQTVDLRVLELLPELSSRDLNHLVVAWDEAAMQEGRDSDAALRRLLRGALARAGEPVTRGDVAEADTATSAPPAAVPTPTA